MLARIAKEREDRHRIQIARLLFAAREIDRPTVDARRGSGLQPSLRELQLAQPMGERYGRRIPGTAGRVVGEPDMDEPVQECSGRQHDCPRTKPDAELRDGADDAIAFEHQIIDGLLEQP